MKLQNYSLCQSILVLFLIFAFQINFISCTKPSYPKEKLEESAQKLLKKEYKLDSKVKLVGATLFLEVELSELFLTTEVENLTKKVIKKLEGAILAAVRVSLSTDAKVNFVVVIAKAKEYDFCLRIIEQIQDIKDYLYMRISRGDYEKRMVLEFMPYSKVKYENLTLDEFVSRLIVARYNMTLKTNPFLGALFNNVSIELKEMTKDTLILKTNGVIPEETTTLLEELLYKFYIDTSKKYNLKNRYEKLVITNNSGKKIFSLNFTKFAGKNKSNSELNKIEEVIKILDIIYSGKDKKRLEIKNE